QPINEFGQVQRHIADAYAHFMAGRSYVYQVAGSLDLARSGTRIDSDAVKLFCDHGQAGRRQRDPGARRLRLRRGMPGRAPVARRQADGDRRRHGRGAPEEHRARSRARGLARLTGVRAHGLRYADRVVVHGLQDVAAGRPRRKLQGTVEGVNTEPVVVTFPGGRARSAIAHRPEVVPPLACTARQPLASRDTGRHTLQRSGQIAESPVDDGGGIDRRILDDDREALGARWWLTPLESG